MDLLFCLRDILSEFRHLFNQQSFALFQAFIFGLIANKGTPGTLTSLYQCSGSKTRYWSFPKFLSRGKWNADAIAAVLIRRIQGLFEEWVYVYDETQALKTGKSQWGLHFFRNFSYQKPRVNQSKFHFGHEFGALGLLCATPTDWQFFPVWVKAVVPQTVRDKTDAVLKRICSKIRPGLIIFDRGFARRKVFAIVRRCGHHILCRAKSNAVFYRLLNFGQFSAGWATHPLRKRHSTPLECRRLDRPISIDIALLRSEEFSTVSLRMRNLRKNTHAFETQRPQNKNCPNFSNQYSEWSLCICPIGAASSFTTHSTPLECGGLDISSSIDIALRWSAGGCDSRLISVSMPSYQIQIVVNANRRVDSVCSYHWATTDITICYIEKSPTKTLFSVPLCCHFTGRCVSL